MLARVKSGGVAAPLRGCGSGPGLRAASWLKASGRGMSFLNVRTCRWQAEKGMGVKAEREP
jgi:hypothetical protein